MLLWGLLLWLCWLSITPGLAEVYRWTDENGKIHFTDNPENIPPHRRASSRVLVPPEVGSPPADRPGTPTPPPVAVPTAPESPASAAEASRLQQRVQVLEQQIATTLQTRQHLLDQLTAVREVRMNPAFGQERRRVDETGREFAMVERQLDSLYAELQQARMLLQEQQMLPQDTTPRQAPGEIVLDRQGRDQTYWQQRAVTLRRRLQQAREQRQALLAQLLPETAEERSAFGRRGREVLQVVQELERTWQDMRATEAAWLALQQEAQAAGAPATWLR